MCDACNDRVLDLILDYVLLGLHLDVSAKLTRDSIIQHTLLSTDDDAQAIDEIRHFSSLVSEQAAKLYAMGADDFRDLLIGRAVLEVLS